MDRSPCNVSCARQGAAEAPLPSFIAAATAFDTSDAVS